MKKIFLSTFFLSLLSVGFAQSGCMVRKAYAFYTVTIAGMPMADENGNTIPPAPVIKRFIYLEWSGAKPPEVDKVLYDKKPYTATVAAVEGNTVVPGGPVGENVEHTITAKKCNSLWMIELQPEVDDKKERGGAASIIIKLKKADGICTFTLAKETLLATLPGY